MSLADEIRNEIENIKELKITVGDINNHLSVLEGLTRKDIEGREKEAYQRGINDRSLDVKQRVEGAYQRGLEDGKWKAEDGCDGCKYYGDTSLTNPCSECSRGCVDHYKPASDPDRIEVGDEVISDTGTKFIVTAFTTSDSVCGFSDRGLGCFNTIGKLTKTGKHYDIQSILGAMKS